MLCLAACGRDEGRTDGGRHPGTPDLDPSCHHDCGPASFCRDGVVYQGFAVPIACRDWTGMCPSQPRPDIVCERGCREGVYADRPENVCEENVPKDVGAPCTAPEHCAPGRQAPDGFGGTAPIALDCDSATSLCVLRAVEQCNGLDDDGDTTIDEDCSVAPSIVASLAASGNGLDVDVSSDRIALLRETTDDVSLAIVAPDGSALATQTGLLHARRIAREPGGWALLRHDGRGIVDEIVRIRDDDTRSAIPVGSAPSSRYVDLVPFGSSYLLLGLTELPGGIALSLHDATTGGRTATGAITVTTPGFGIQHAPLGTDLLLLNASFGTPIDSFRIAPSLGATTLTAHDRRGALGGLAVRAGLLYAVVEDLYSGHVLAGVDPVSGAWTSAVPLGMLVPTTPTTFPPVLAADGDDLVVSWVDADGMLRTIVLDASGARIGTSIIEVGAPQGGLWAGSTSAGPRVVVPTATGWLLIAPAVRRAP